MKTEYTPRYLEQSKKIRQNFDTGTRKGQEREPLITASAWSFTALEKSYTYGAKTGHWALSPPYFHLFLAFPNFLKSKVLSCLTTREATHMISLCHGRY